jgi:hypothetical protein
MGAGAGLPVEREDVHQRRKGRLAVIRWTREHDCPWDTESMWADAAWSGHLAVLQWVREHGCP